MSWITLTNPAGEPVFINIDQIISVHNALHDTPPDHPSATWVKPKARLSFVDGKENWVREDPAEVLSIIKAAL
jgi:hypothetical protein